MAETQTGSLKYVGYDEDSNDYVLEGTSAWIQCGPLAVYVRAVDEQGFGIGEPVGVEVSITRHRAEDDTDLATCVASFADALCPHCNTYCYQEGDGCEGFQASRFDEE